MYNMWKFHEGKALVEMLNERMQACLVIVHLVAFLFDSPSIA
jgi:hypothetical protein